MGNIFSKQKNYMYAVKSKLTHFIILILRLTWLAPKHCLSKSIISHWILATVFLSHLSVSNCCWSNSSFSDVQFWPSTVVRVDVDIEFVDDSSVKRSSSSPMTSSRARSSLKEKNIWNPDNRIPIFQILIFYSFLRYFSLLLQFPK